MDAQIVEAKLASANIACRTQRVCSSTDFKRAVEGGDVDLILSDLSLPGFDGLTALQWARQTHPEIPFIVLSGTVGEEVAVDTLRSGATDYVLKDRLARLAPAVAGGLVNRVITMTSMIVAIPRVNAKPFTSAEAK